MGKCYYAVLRAAYAPQSSASKQLQVDNADEIVPDDLVQGILKAKKSTPQRNALLHWLAITEKIPNQKSLIGLCRFSLELKPWTSSGQLELLAAVMDFFVRARATAQYPVEMQIMKSSFDKTLEFLWMAARREGIQPVEWFQLQKKRCGLVVNLELWEKLLAARGSWGDHEDLVAVVVADSGLARQMFGSLLQKVANAKLSKVVAAFVNTLRDEHIATELVSATKTKIHEELSKIAKSEDWPPRREIAVTYRGSKVVMRVSSVGQEIDYAMAALMKSLAVEQKQLEELFCETDLIPTGVRTGKGKVDSVLLEGAKVARRLAKEQLVGETNQGAAAIRAFLAQREPALSTVDSSFAVEVAFFTGLADSAGAQKMHELVLETLPKPGDLKGSPAATIDKLKHILDGALAKFVSTNILGETRACLEMVEAVSLGHAVPVSKGGGSILTQLIATLPNLVVYTPGKCKPLQGKAALEAMIADCSAGMHKEKDMPLKLLQPLIVFAYMLDAEQNLLVKKWGQEVLGKHTASAAATSSGAASSSKTSAAVGAAAHAKKVGKDAVLSLFS